MPFVATWMELETLILSEVRKRKANTIWNLIYGTNEPFHRKETHGLGEDLWLPKGRGRGKEWDGLGVWG